MPRKNYEEHKMYVKYSTRKKRNLKKLEEILGHNPDIGSLVKPLNFEGDGIARVRYESKCIERKLFLQKLERIEKEIKSIERGR